ncbi:unnamed protein product [Prorocentrum cordatum]|uniref:Lysine-specific metallo-endopeptidase domain-containing protein n=1 Tax=Prorocentrum cordatum TaxID=2364126 RepID=A0ABN9RDB9_9DINO|nr:unnamed protein product [Polarella glacialis]
MGSDDAEVVVQSIQKVATAQAWAANAVRNIGNNQRSDLLTKWFGSKSSRVRQIAKQTANSVIEVLESCEIRTDEQECNKMPGVLAYVYPGMKNSQGQYVMFMCDASLNYNPLTGVLYHEAAHHPYSNRDDVIYGRGDCQELAQSNPNGALNNADSHEYYVTDLNTR